MPSKTMAVPLMFASLATGSWSAHAQTPEQSARKRADAVLASLDTVDRKLEAARDGFKSVSIPDPRPSDGPAGMRTSGVTTALPSPITSAASFDPTIAALHGDVLGAEARAAGVTTIYGPAMDVLRTWQAGRVAESFGEDPLLASAMAVSVVRAVQAHHVIATVKHYAAYTQEAGRLGDSPIGTRPSVNVRIGERALREIYLAPFEAAVVEGKAGGVMCAFPRINGVFACENPQLLGVLKNEWGFDGAVSPDFPDAQRSVVAAINAGLDIGAFYPVSPFPGAPASTPGGDIDLSAAVKAGSISRTRLDDLLRRRLVPGFRLRVFEKLPVANLAANLSTAEHRRAAVTIAEAGAVLLRNEGGLLPLGTKRRIAVIGAQAGSSPVVAEGGSANVVAHATTPAWKAIAARAGVGTATTYEPGVPDLGEAPLVPVSAFRTADGRQGLDATYVNNPRREFGSDILVKRVEPGVALDAAPALPGLAANNGWSVRWSGTFTPPQGGLQRFTIAGSGSARLVVGGKVVSMFHRADFSTTAYASVALAAGKPVDIAVEWSPREAAPMPRMALFGTAIGTSLHLGWTPLGDSIDRAAAVAARSDVALVYVAKESSEGADQTSLALPAEQDALIEAVARANPRTVVVVSAGGAVAMPWLSKVAAVIDLWFSGDAHATASTALLFGDAAPGGRLPMTFPLKDEQGPGFKSATYPGVAAADGSLADVTFDEGLAVGYRYFLSRGQKPLFPFGFGLSYAPFTFGAPLASVSGRGLSVAVDIHNAGNRTDSAVVQAYITHPSDAGEPSKMLAGFAKVQVAAGRSGRGVINIAERAFQHWDERSHRWMSTAGEYRIDIGKSVVDLSSTIVAHVAADGSLSVR